MSSSEPVTLLAKYRTIITSRSRTPGESIEDFCKSIGIGVHIYYYWKRRIFSPTPEAPFIPVAHKTPKFFDPRVEVIFTNGARLFVPQEHLADTLCTLAKLDRC